MNDHQESVRDFMIAMQQALPLRPTLPDINIQKLRAILINEETGEFIEAVYSPTPEAELNIDIRLDALTPIADAIADLLYVVHGAALAYGMDIHPVFNIVHASNMKKIGGSIREDGKRLKNIDWISPTEAIRQELKRQITSNVPSHLESTIAKSNQDVDWEGEI